MARYYFNLDDGTDYPDLDGTELPDLAAARQEALRFAGALVSNLGEDFWLGQEWALRVADENDLTLFSLMLVGYDAPAVQSEARDAKSAANGSGSSN